MRKLLLLLAVLTALSFTVGTDDPAYVCGNGKTEVYHLKKTCQGMKRCTHEILQTTVSEAKKDGLRMCGYED